MAIDMSAPEPDSQPPNIPWAAVAQDELDSEGEDPEMHVYGARYNTRGKHLMLQVGTKTDFRPEKDTSHNAALVLIRVYDPDRSLKSTVLEVRSKYIRKALQLVIGNYP